MFITLDGIDGVGKSTQVARLAAHLTDRGHDVLTVRDPGTTPLGSRLRSLLLESELTMHRRSEAMLFMASRCELVETVIRPAIAQQKTVISDRFLLANVVYQSIGGDVDAQTLWTLGDLANGGLRPDVTLLLDMPADAALARIDRAADRMESRGLEYLNQVRRAFLQQLSHSSPVTHVIDAQRSPDAVSDDILARF